MAKGRAVRAKKHKLGNTQQQKEKTMPPIQFNDKDLLRGTVVDTAWYRVRINAVGEALSKDGGSTNYPVKGTIIVNADNGDTTFSGVPLDWNFNSKAIGFVVLFLKAFGVEVDTRTRYDWVSDLASAEGKELDVYVENGEWQGRVVNRMNHKYRSPRSS